MIANSEHWDPLLVSTSFLRLAQSWSYDPAGLPRRLSEAAVKINRSVVDEMGRALNDLSIPHGADPKQGIEDGQAWYLEAAKRNHRVLRDSHAAWSDWMDAFIADAPGLDDDHRERCRFWSGQLAGALAPSNFFWANPGAVQRCLQTGGESISKGYANWLRDQQESKGLVATVDRDRFQVGVDLAATPGVVVHRNRLMELIQYAPSTDQVFETPIVFIQPWINKYYILDLAPERSLMAWLRDQGFTVFSISWKNPDSAMQDVGFEDYVLEGALEAIETARSIAGTKSVHAVGFCIGGTALASLMAWLSDPAAQANGDRPACPVAHWTLFTTLVDFSNPGELERFTSEGAVESAETLMERDGYLDGSVTETVFRLLRSDSLIWHHAVRNYLYGDAPSRSDVLYWNSDSTRLPRRMLSFYLRELYLNNRLVSDQGLTLAGRQLRLSNIEQPLYAVGCVQDHIAPWTEVFRVRDHVRVPIRFSLSSEGHVAGIVNPPSAKSRRRYWSGDVMPGLTSDDWLTAQTPLQGSWWTDWAAWLSNRCGPQVSPPSLGTADHPAMCAAPGTYVLE
jgi:polyhydroxyalkanoate synthase